jgi:pilus assembly protein Flp/PilA
MKNLFNLFKDESGQGMVEYGLIIAAVALAVIFALGTLGGGIEKLFDDANKSLTNPLGTS